MVKRFGILFLTIFVILIPAESGRGEGLTRQGLLRDGFALSGIDGKVSSPDSNEGWFLELNSDVTDDRAVVKKGTSLQLLPSVTLEKITADLRKRPSATYQLWGRATKYKGKNFIFPFYFLPLSKIEQPQSETPEAPQKPQPQSGLRLGLRPDEKEKPLETPFIEKDDSDFGELSRAEPIINEPNDVLAIPQEIIEKLRARRLEPAKWPDTDTGREAEPIIQPGYGSGSLRRDEPPRIKKVRQTFQQDSILADRTALLVKQDDGQLVFILDALGRSTSQISLRLLPCGTLELTEQRQSAELEPLRFKIAGIMTKYKGQNYLLLQKATRVYSHGNFAR